MGRRPKRPYNQWHRRDCTPNAEGDQEGREALGNVARHGRRDSGKRRERGGLAHQLGAALVHDDGPLGLELIAPDYGQGVARRAVGMEPLVDRLVPGPRVDHHSGLDIVERDPALRKARRKPGGIRHHASTPTAIASSVRWTSSIVASSVEVPAVRPTVR